jgi:hypothetical protein
MQRSKRPHRVGAFVFTGEYYPSSFVALFLQLHKSFVHEVCQTLQIFN